MNNFTELFESLNHSQLRLLQSVFAKVLSATTSELISETDTARIHRLQGVCGQLTDLDNDITSFMEKRNK